MEAVKILVVDDEETVRRLCARAFEDAGYQCATAASGEAALPLLDGPWDLVLTDMSMPGTVNGTELLRRARAAGSADVIIMTGRPELDTAIQSVQGGAYDYLVKPFQLEHLLATVGRCVERRRLSRDLAREKELRAELERAHDELTRLNKVKDTFGQFATPEVVRMVLDQPDDFWRRGERRTVTVAFVDVRGFTPFASRVAPEEAVATLNAIFRRALRDIDAEGGLLNKFVGDGMMAVFGALTEVEGHAAAAARAALRAQARVEAHARARARRGKEPLGLRWGLNTGEVVAGCLGTRKRTEYSVIGHAVNMASRLEGANKFFGSRIMAGEETARLAAGAVEMRELGRIRMVGGSRPMRVYEFLAEKGGLNDAWRRALPAYERGLALFGERRYADAADAFRAALADAPGDGPSARYLDFAARFAADAPREDWDGVFDMETK